MITTKKRDQGKSYFLGKSVDKDGPLLEAIGSIDELQSVLELINFEERIIDDLEKIMGEVSCGIKFKKYDLRIKEMEEKIEKMPKINKFLKFQKKKALELNWARTVCRRVERRVIALTKREKINSNIMKYINRLSDYLFLQATKENKK